VKRASNSINNVYTKYELSNKVHAACLAWLWHALAPVNDQRAMFSLALGNSDSEQLLTVNSRI